ncbi:hypothetical protein EJB05_07936 [Eragrostis curvula]|uniref:DUF4005 domain-containing protein n=1 Tax=Eragrostis curvula TaxID=38414 RepID=A0A5J9WJQ4_9POAL|nr:hypothetical protein EJB05_07936 [Eragrostis curvula]
MRKAGRWLKSFLSGKKERPQHAEAMMPVLALPPPTPKEKRWSFRRPVPAGKLGSESPAAARGASDDGLGVSASGMEFDQKKHAVAVAVATAAAADAAVAAAHAAAEVARLSSRRAHLPANLVEDAAAVRIQATFRGYLARTALCALRGIVKLQALVRGQLVRKQANATLRCMQALLAAQSQLRMRVLQEQRHHHQTPPRPRRSPQHPRHRRPYEMDKSCEENAKIVEVDTGEPARRGSAKADRQLFMEHHGGRCSPAPSAVTELSPRAYSGHFDELFSAATTAQSSPQHGSSSELCPSYMANTESSRAKQARSQSAPRQRTADAPLERQPSRRKGTPPRTASAPRTTMMQRSASLVGAAPRVGSQSPWWSASSGARLDASNASECGSTTSSVLTAATVYSRTRSLVGFEGRRGLY